MSPELWTATLNPSGPNYERLRDIFPSRVPLKSSKPHKAQLGEEKDVSVFLLDLSAMPLNERSRLVALIAAKTGASVTTVSEVVAREGFPIREADLIVSYDMGAFV